MGNDCPPTSPDPFEPYHPPPEPLIRANLPPQTSLHYSPNDPLHQECRAESTALHEHIAILNKIIASQRTQLTLNSLATQKYKHELYGKEQQVQDTAQQWLFNCKPPI